MEATHVDDVVHMDETFRIIYNLCEDITQASLNQVLENSSYTSIMELFGVYIKFLRGGNGNLSTFWLSYIDMIEILLELILATREGDWMLHMASVRAMIPCYYAEISQLPTTHLDVHV